MILRSLASLRLVAFLAALLAVSACSDDRLAQLSAVQTIDIPAADPGTQANQNIANPTLVIPDTFPVSEGDELTLVFNEDFDGPDINPEVWFFATGDGTEKGLPGGWGNNELQYYLPDNAMIVNGVLGDYGASRDGRRSQLHVGKNQHRGSLRLSVWPYRGEHQAACRAGPLAGFLDAARRTAIMSAVWTIKETTAFAFGQRPAR